MVFLLVYIPAYRQLRKIRKNLIDWVEKAVESHVGECADAVQSTPGSYLYVSGESKRQMHLLATGAAKLDLCLSERRQQLQGYGLGLLVDEDSGIEDAAVRLRSLLLYAPVTDGMWTNRGSVSTFSSYFEVDFDGAAERAIRLRGRGESEAGDSDADDRYVDSAGASALEAAVTGFVTTNRVAGAMLVGGNSLIQERTANRVIASVALKDASDFWLITRPVGQRDEGYEALVMTVRWAEPGLKGIGLAEPKASVWNRIGQRLLSPGNKPVSREDILFALELCFDRYLQYAAERGLTPVWHVSGYRWLSEECRSVIEETIDRKPIRRRVFCVVADAKETTMPASCLDDEAWSRVEVGNRASGLASISRELTHSAAELYRVVTLLDGLLEIDELQAAMEERGVRPVQFRHDWEQLVGCGAVYAESPPTVRRDMTRWLGDLLDETRLDPVRSWLSGYLQFLRREGRTVEGVSAVEVLATERGDAALEVLQRLLRSVCEERDRGSCRRLLDRMGEIVERLPGGDELLDAMQLRIAGDAGIVEGAERSYDWEATGFRRRGVRAELACACAEWLECQGHLHDALNWAKRSVMLADEVDPFVEVRANLGIGREMLGLGRAEEAQAYFDNATALAERSKDVSGQVRGLLRSAVTHLLTGNLSRADRTLGKAHRIAEDHGLYRWLVYVEFLRGRVSFDLGRYDEAQRWAASGRCVARIHSVPGTEGSLLPLLYRAAAYARDLDWLSGRMMELDQSDETRMLLGECSFFSGDYDEALRAVDRTDFAPSGRVDTSLAGIGNGLFGPVEGSAGIDVSRRMIEAYRALFTALTGDESRVPVEEYAEMIREEHLDPYDANNGLYCYLYAMHVATPAQQDLERMTALSRAAKYVQTRAARIDDAPTRQEYLRNNYWNRRIVDEARSHKLV